MLQAHNILGRPDPTVWGGPLPTQRRCHGAPKHLLAQSPEMDHELLFSHPYRDPCSGILPPPGRPPDLSALKIGGASGCLLPPEINPVTTRLHASFPSLWPIGHTTPQEP